MAVNKVVRRYSIKSAGGHHSPLEDLVAEQLDRSGVGYLYEPGTLQYVVAPRRYRPDFILASGIILEAKGQFQSSDRSKHKAIREQYPDLDIRFVFSSPNSRIGSTSKTTYAMWCERLGIPWTNKKIPEEWLKESPEPRRIAAIQDALGIIIPT